MMNMDSTLNMLPVGQNYTQILPIECVAPAFERVPYTRFHSWQYKLLIAMRKFGHCKIP